MALKASVLDAAWDSEQTGRGKAVELGMIPVMIDA